MSKWLSIELSLLLLVSFVVLAGFLSLNKDNDSFSNDFTGYAVQNPQQFSYSTGYLQGLPHSKIINFGGLREIKAITGQTCFYHKKTGSVYELSYNLKKEGKTVLDKVISQEGGKGGKCAQFKIDIPTGVQADAFELNGRVIKGSPNAYNTIFNIAGVEVEIPISQPATNNIPEGTIKSYYSKEISDLKSKYNPVIGKPFFVPYRYRLMQGARLILDYDGIFPSVYDIDNSPIDILIDIVNIGDAPGKISSSNFYSTNFYLETTDGRIFPLNIKEDKSTSISSGSTTTITITFKDYLSGIFTAKIDSAEETFRLPILSQEHTNDFISLFSCVSDFTSSIDQKDCFKGQQFLGYAISEANSNSLKNRIPAQKGQEPFWKLNFCRSKDNKMLYKNNICHDDVKRQLFIFQFQQKDTVPLYQCQDSNSSNSFLSLKKDCEGNMNSVALGFILTKPEIPQLFTQLLSTQAPQNIASKYPSCTSLVYNGDTNKLDLVFFGNTNIPEASRILSGGENSLLFSQEPFKSNFKKFNIWYINNPYTIKLIDYKDVFEEGINIVTGKSIYDTQISGALSFKSIGRDLRNAGRKIDKNIIQPIVQPVKKEAHRARKKVIKFGKQFEKNVIRPIPNSLARIVLESYGIQRIYDNDAAKKFARKQCPFADQVIYLQDNELTKSDPQIGSARISGYADGHPSDFVAMQYKASLDKDCFRFSDEDNTYEYCLDLNDNKNTLMHELGHSIAGLEDEYDKASADNRDIISRLIVEASDPVTTKTNCRKEEDCLDFKSIDNNAGCYQGCERLSFYRPYEKNSIMLDDGPYRPIHTYYFNQAMQKYK